MQKQLEDDKARDEATSAAATTSAHPTIASQTGGLGADAFEPAGAAAGLDQADRQGGAVVGVQAQLMWEQHNT